MSVDAELDRLRARVAELEKIDLDTSRMFRALNGMDIDDWDERADMLMRTTLDGLNICDANRLMVKGLLAEHFADIGARAERAEARVAELEVDLAAAQEVIEIFADYATRLDRHWMTKNYSNECRLGLCPDRLDDGVPTVGDLRRARAFLERIASPQEAERCAEACPAIVR